MIYLFIAVWIWWSEPSPLNQISRNNQARRDAEMAYRSGQYGQALGLYAALSRTTTTIDPAVRLNLGHTYFQLKRYNKARSQYETLMQSDRSDLRTAAATQLGVIACIERDSAVALASFERALLENPDNELARYNFELIKKRFSGKVPPTKENRTFGQRPTKTVNKSRASTGQQVERSARQDDILRSFQQLNLSQEQALQLLDAMQDNDLPYALTQSAHRPAPKPQTGDNRW